MRTENQSSIEQAKKMNTIKNQIESQLLRYYSNDIPLCALLDNYILTPPKIEELMVYISGTQRSWDSLECEIEGATQEQEKEIDLFLSKTIDNIIEIILK